MIFVKISQNFIKSPFNILVYLTDFSPQCMACMQDQVGQNVEPGLDPNSMKDFFKDDDVKRSAETTKIVKNYQHA